MTEPRTLPHNREAEAAVLGGILLRGRDALGDAVELLAKDGDDFYVPAFGAVFRGMVILEERGEPIDVVTLEAQLRRTGELELVGGIEGLARLDRHATAHNIKAHAELILEAAQVRRTVVACRDIAEEGMTAVADPAEFLATAAKAVADATASRIKAPYAIASTVVAKAFEEIMARRRRGDGATGRRTGLRAVDGMTQGHQRSDLIIMAARPSMGKTALWLQFMLHGSIWTPAEMRQDPETRRLLAPSLLFSLEMSTTQLVERGLAAESKLALSDIRGATPGWMEGDFRTLIGAAERLGAGKFAIDDTPGLKLAEINAKARRWACDRDLWPTEEQVERRIRYCLESALDMGAPEIVAKAKAEAATDVVGLIGLDYLQLAHGDKRHYGSREEEISEISRGLKGLAKGLNVPVLALAQLNRKVDDRSDHHPQLADLRESGAIEQDADVIEFIYREERYLPADAPEEKVRALEGKAEIIIGKQRNGPIGTVNAHWDARTTSFRDVEETF